MSENRKAQLVEVTKENVEQEHICCAISATTESRACAAAKKQWMLREFAQGYRFFKVNVRGKALMELVPAENAWSPVAAPGWLFIDCFWIAGKYKGQGYGKKLLTLAKEQAAQGGFKGLVALSTQKKRGFLSDPGFYRHMGFAVADTAPPDYILFALPLAEGAEMPRFINKPAPKVESRGVVLYYSDHCPHTSRYVPLLAAAARDMGVPFTGIKVENKDDARNVPNPWPTYALFYNGNFVTNEIYTEGKLRKLVEDKRKNG